MNDLIAIMKAFEEVLWGVPLLVLLVGVGIYLTVLLKGLQFRYFFKSFTLLGAKEENTESSQGDISPFESLMTAMASAVGTGGIVGMATAVMTGGLGAVFWMWVMSLIGMAIKYAESMLAVQYRITDKRGEMAGGPMYYIEKGLGWKSLAVLFAIFAAVAAIGTGNLVQANAIAESINNVFAIDPLYTGMGLFVITAFVLLRGIKSIGFVSSLLVPIMAGFYIFAGIAVLWMFKERVPEAIGLIFSSAFSGQAASGGFLGASVMMAMKMGVSRSLFSSEAGLGISSIAAAAARTSSSSKQALISMIGTVLSTAIICSITALVIAVTGVIGKCDASGNVMNGATLAIQAFDSAVWGGKYIVTLGLILFAYTTIIAWAYYGEKCSEYLFGEKSVVYYRVFYTFLVIPGAIFALDLVWSFANIMNALMVIPNMIAIFRLSKVIRKEANDFVASQKHKEIHAIGEVA